MGKKRFRIGDLVRVQMLTYRDRDKPAGNHFYGTVSTVNFAGGYNSNIGVRTLRDGLLSETSVTLMAHDVNLCTRRDLIDGFEQLLDPIRTEVEDKRAGGNGVLAAFAVRKEYNLKQILARFRRVGRDNSEESPLETMGNIEPPHSGVYVAIPIYTGNGPSPRNAVAIAIKPRLDDESCVGELLTALSIPGIRRKGEVCYDLEATTGGSLIGYTAYEIPYKGVRMIGVMNVLRWSLKLK